MARSLARSSQGIREPSGLTLRFRIRAGNVYRRVNSQKCEGPHLSDASGGFLFQSKTHAATNARGARHHTAGFHSEIFSWVLRLSDWLLNTTKVFIQTERRVVKVSCDGTRELKSRRRSSSSGKTARVWTASSAAEAWTFPPPACVPKSPNRSTNRPM
jgi:hypothetical protein